LSFLEYQKVSGGVTGEAPVHLQEEDFIKIM
jgi:hypothetical protein